MYRIFYIMSEFLSTAYQPFRLASTAIPEAAKVCPKPTEAPMKRTILALALLGAAGGCEPAMDHLKAMHGEDAHATAEAQASKAGPSSGDVTVDIQGGAEAWRKSPFILQYYALTKASFVNGADKVDFAAYQEKSYAIFRAFGAATGGGKAAEEGMLDHLKDIPRQMVGIVKEDPSVLESYDKFWIALSGPP
jgi:hypothetical protein